MTTTVNRNAREARTMPLRDLTAATATPVATIRANLLPAEVVGKRRLTWLRRRLALALVALLLLVAAGYLLARQQTSSSQDELDAARQQTTALSGRVNGYNSLLALQAQTTQLRTQLASVMTSDVQWNQLFTALGAAAPAGVVVTQLSAKTASTSAAASTPDPADQSLLPSGTQVAGTITLSGTARDYRSVASFSDRLGQIAGFVRVEPSNVSTEGSSASFDITITLSSAVYSGRFTPKAGK